MGPKKETAAQENRNTESKTETHRNVHRQFSTFSLFVYYAWIVNVEPNCWVQRLVEGVDDVKFCACNSNRKNSIVCQMFKILARGFWEWGLFLGRSGQSEGKRQLWILKFGREILLRKVLFAWCFHAKKEDGGPYKIIIDFLPLIWT